MSKDFGWNPMQHDDDVREYAGKILAKITDGKTEPARLYTVIFGAAIALALLRGDDVDETLRDITERNPFRNEEAFASLLESFKEAHPWLYAEGDAAPDLDSPGTLEEISMLEKLFEIEFEKEPAKDE